MASLRILEKGLFLAALTLVACNKEGDDSDTGSDSGDTDTSPSYLTPVFIAISGGFGYDKTAGQIVDVSFPDIVSSQGSATAFSVSPYMAVELYEEPSGSQLTEEDLVCTITVEQAGPIATTTSLGGDTSQAIAFVFDFTKATIEHDCDGLLDPALWGEDLSASIAGAGVQWGLGVDATVEASISTWIEDQVKDQPNGATLWTEQWEGRLLGARPYFTTTGTLVSSGAELYWGNAQAIDATHKVMWDDAAGSSAGVWEIDSEDPITVLAADVPATASYSISTGPSVVGFEGLEQVFLGVEQ